MRVYFVSLGAGLLVGVVYSCLSVRSPAPPLVALVGLLGILLGEQALPLVRHVFQGETLSAAWRASGSQQHVFGMLPGRHAPHVILSTRAQADRGDKAP